MSFTKGKKPGKPPTSAGPVIVTPTTYRAMRGNNLPDQPSYVSLEDVMKGIGGSLLPPKPPTQNK